MDKNIIPLHEYNVKQHYEVVCTLKPTIVL